MSRLRLRHRALVTALALVGLLAYLLVVEFGVSAGLIHHGVRVGAVDVGGLTEGDAVDRLGEVGHRMRDERIVFTGGGLLFTFTPREFGWLPLERLAARLAKQVGRTGGVVGVLSERVRAWRQGVVVRWPDKLNTRWVGTRLRRLDRRAEALGYELDRPKMRRRIRRAIWDWPRRPFYEIPVRRAG